MGDKAILGDCLDYIRQEGFKLVTSVLVADAMDYQVETNDAGSMDVDAAIKEQRIVLTGGPQSNGTVTSTTNLSWSVPNVMAADFATPQLMDKIRGRISTASKVAVASGTGEINTAIVLPDRTKVPVWTKAVPFNVAGPINEAVEPPPNVRANIRNSVLAAFPAGLSPHIVETSPSISGRTALSSTAPANLIFDTNLTANSGAVVAQAPGGVSGWRKSAPIELASSALLSGKIELYKRFSGRDKLLVSISPNRAARPEQNDTVSIVATDPDERTADLTEGGLVVTPDENNRRAETFRKMLAQAPDQGKNNFLITHKPNIVDALGKDWFDVKEGEASIFKPERGKYQLIARVQMEDWPKLAAGAN